jgi:hypothetical protein
MSRLRSPRDGETLTSMVPTVDVAARLWEHLEGLSRGLDPQQLSIPTVRVTVDSGAMLEVFRAEPVEAAMAAWRVRGFTGGTAVRLAVILGTRDGRAMVTERVSDESEEAVVGGLVGERALVDLSEAIARAVRALMGEPPA